MSANIPHWLKLNQEVQQALANGSPLVALESTVITHGLPRPQNLELAKTMEQLVRQNQSVPATIGFLAGVPHVGFSSEELETLASDETANKISRRDIGPARALGWSGGTTVSATMVLSRLGGIQIFATGGIGGVHHGQRGDVSTDLMELARTPVAVVCAGAKAILDLPRTLEWLETAGVPVVGFQTDEFPAFYSRTSGLPVSARADDVDQLASILMAHWSTGFESGVLICAPCPPDSALPYDQVNAWVEQAEGEAQQKDVRGKNLTPFLLSRLSEISEGATLKANLALLHNNAVTAARLAAALK